MEPKDREQWEKDLRDGYNYAGEQFKRKVEKYLWQNGYLDLNNVPWSLWGEYQGNLEELFGPTITKAFETHAKAVLRNVPLSFSWDLVHEQAMRWSRTYTFDLVRWITNTDRQLLQSALSRYFELGMSLEEVREIIQQSPAFSAARAEMIATTEITRASVQGELWIVDEVGKAGFEMVSIWNTNADELVCPICGPRNQKEQGKGWSDPPPAHPRCRCWLNHVPKNAPVTEQKPLETIPVNLPDLGELPDPSRVTEMGLKKYMQTVYPNVPVEWNPKYVYNEAMEQQIAKELYNLKRMGFPEEYLPEAFRVGYKGDFDDPGTVAFYWHKRTNKIHFNAQSSGWDPEERLRLVQEGWWATDDTTAHELSHRAHWIFQEKYNEQAGRTGWDMRYVPRLGLTPEEYTLIRQQVSTYGASNNYETVAEILSGMLHGKKYGPEVMRIYKKYGGPAYPGLAEYTEEELEKLIRAGGLEYLDEVD